MRVGLLLDRFPTTTETFISTAAIGLLEAGCEVSVLARRRPVRGEPKHSRDRRLRRRTTYLDTELGLNVLWPVASVPLAPGLYDVQHAHFGSNAQRWLFAREQADAPLVVTFHGVDLSADPHVQGEDMYSALWRVVDSVTYHSEFARRSLKRLSCPPEKLRLLRMPVDVGTFPFRPREWDGRSRLRIVTVARLVEKKGHEVALRAMAERRGELPPLTYDVVGDGPLAGHIAGLVRRLGLEDVVTLHGARNDAYVRHVLDDAHVFLLPSRRAANGDQEGTPVSLMEAQACGLPVVSTRHAGIPEVVVDGRAGLLVPENDVTALAEALVRIVAERESWEAMGAAGRAYVEATFDVSVCTPQLLAIYEDAITAYAAERRPEPSVR